MGADLSQSQQLRNLYPISQYKILSADAHFPNLTIIQRINDSAVFAVHTESSLDKYIQTKSPYIIKRTQKHQIHKKTYGMYQWATANVYGLVQYVTHIDKSRKISSQQFKSIVQGSIRAYSALALNGSQLDCLNIKMQNLRIFNEVNIKRNSSNQKQVVNTLAIKVIPAHINDKQSNNSSSKWKHVGNCIHRDGILTQKQLLGQYLLQLSNYAAKSDYSNNNDSLAKTSQQFGPKYQKIIRALLDNQSWNKIVGLLSLQEQKTKIVQKKIQQKQNIQKEQNKQNNPKPSEKTLPNSDKTISQDNLFKGFSNQSNLPLVSQRSIYQNNNMRSRITSIGNFKSISPIKTQRILSPSIQVIRDVTPLKVNRDYPNVDNDYATVPKIPTPQLQKVISRIAYQPDALRQTTNYFPNDNRRPSMIQQQQNYFSPRQQKSRINYFNSPEKIQKQQPLKPQKRKGKKIVFETSTINKPLQINLSKYQKNYEPKTFFDVYNQQKEYTKKQQTTKKQSQTSFFQDNLFDSKQFNKKYNQNFFNQQKNSNSLIKSFAKPLPKHNYDLKIQSRKKDQINTKNNLNHSEYKHNNLGIKQAQSEELIIFNQHQNKIRSPLHQKPPTQSKYIGTMNINGQKQGQGKLYFPSGGSYIGQFYKDFMHGKGKLYYPSGKIAYQGNFKYDKFHDHGKLYNENSNHIHTFDFRNFNKLEVTQKQQPIHRQHHLISPIQKQKKLSYWKFYQGQMSYDMKHGKGVLMLQNGEKYEGQFKNDLVSGVGLFYGKNGNLNGRWDDNLLVEVYR